VSVIIRASDLKPGDMFETLHTKAAGTRKENRKNASSYGIPCELWYPDGKEADVSLHPRVQVKLLGRAN
jgi:hypothetical protein